MTTMTGYNKVTGAYFTKADIKVQIIEKIKKYEAELEKYEDPTFHAYQMLMSEISRLEYRLAKEYNMNEEEIFLATH